MSFKGDQLRYFAAVAEEGQITRAARRLHIAQPALSQAITQLEKELGVQLLERHTRGVRLTAAGEVFYEKARVAVAATADAAETARWLARAQERTIEFGFLGSAPGLDSPALLTAYSLAHPRVTLRFRELRFPSASTGSWLAEVDVAVCHRPRPEPGVWTQALRFDPRWVLAPAAHRLAGRRELELAEVLDETFIGFHPSVEPSWAGFWSLDDHRGGPPERRTDDRAATPQEVLAALAVRDAITTIPASVARVVANGGLNGVVVIPVRDCAPCRLVLVGREDRRNGVVASLLAFACRHAAELSEPQPQPLPVAQSVG